MAYKHDNKIKNIVWLALSEGVAGRRFAVIYLDGVARIGVASASLSALLDSVSTYFVIV